MKLAAAPASAEDWSTAGPPDRTAVQVRSVRRLTAALWAATLLAALAVLALTLIIWGDLKLRDGISNLASALAAVAYATLGVLIVRRAAARAYVRSGVVPGPAGPALAANAAGERVLLRERQDSDIADRLGYPFDPGEYDSYGSSWRRDWDGCRCHTREHLGSGVRRR